MYGALIQLAGMGYQAEMNGRADDRALAKTRAGRDAEQQYGGYAADDEKQTSDYLRQLSLARLNNQGQLAANLSGRPMLDAAQAGQNEYGNRLASVLGNGQQVMGANAGGLGRGGMAMRNWRAAAAARSAPRLGSQARLVTLAGRRQGADAYRQGQMNDLAEASITLDRKTQERLRRSALLDAYRQRKLNDILRANGVDTGEAGMRASGALVAGLAGAAGGALNSYQANRPAASAANSNSFGGDVGGSDLGGGSGSNASQFDDSYNANSAFT